MRLDPTFDERRGDARGRISRKALPVMRPRRGELPVGTRPSMSRAALGALGVALCGGVALAIVLVAPSHTAQPQAPVNLISVGAGGDPDPDAVSGSGSMASTSTSTTVPGASSSVAPDRPPAVDARILEFRALAGARAAQLAALVSAPAAASTSGPAAGPTAALAGVPQTLAAPTEAPLQVQAPPQAEIPMSAPVQPAATPQTSSSSTMATTPQATSTRSAPTSTGAVAPARPGR